MGGSFLGTIGSVASIALTVAAVRWLVNSKGSRFPNRHSGSSEYRIKWQWRMVGLVGGTLPVAVSIWTWRDLYSREGEIWIAFAVLFVVTGVWLAVGSVTTNQAGIAMKGLWSSRSFQWTEITEIRLHKRDGGAIELRSGARKIVIDTRFEAFQHLLNEIETHTKLSPRRD
jgi:hypothetical protein